tara:strand:- start:127 stop:258 length:132 start_codon:yes stop_codon:yes gene_type:complete
LIREKAWKTPIRQNTSWNRLKVVNDKSNAIKKPLYKGLVTLAK